MKNEHKTKTGTIRRKNKRKGKVKQVFPGKG